MIGIGALLACSNTTRQIVPDAPTKSALKVYAASDFMLFDQTIEFENHLSLLDEEDVRFSAVDSIRIKYLRPTKLPPVHCVQAYLESSTHHNKSQRDEWDDTSYVLGDHYCLGARGLVQYHSSRDISLEDRPALIPNHFRLGERWSKGSKSCEVHETNFCQDGIAVECDELLDGPVFLWQQNHYCPSWGWVGKEALTVLSGQTASVPIVFSVGLAQKLSNRVKLVVEVDSGAVVGEYDEVADGFLAWYGLRFGNDFISANVGFVKPVFEDTGDEFPIGFPWVSLVYRALPGS